MKICYVADARDVHFRRFLQNLLAVDSGYEVLVVSTRYCPQAQIGSARVVNLTSYAGVTTDVSTPIRKVINRLYRVAGEFPLHGLMEGVKYLWDFSKMRKKAIDEIAAFDPDLIHGMRLQLEGLLAGRCTSAPLAISLYGTDLVYFAERNPLIGHLVRQTLRRTSFLIADNARDARLVRNWGLPSTAMVYVMPAQGGIDFEVFKIKNRRVAKEKLGLRPDRPSVVCLRGFSGSYHHTTTLVQSVPLVLANHPGTTFIIHGRTHSAGGDRLRRIARRLGCDDSIRFLDIPTAEVPQTLQACDAIVSPTSVDGTPMSMLEAMACGCVPVMSDIDSIREWIQDGVSGFLFDPRSPGSLAGALSRALNCNADRVASFNAVQLRKRAVPQENMKVVADIYRRLCAARSGSL